MPSNCSHMTSWSPSRAQSTVHKPGVVYHNEVRVYLISPTPFRHESDHRIGYPILVLIRWAVHGKDLLHLQCVELCTHTTDGVYICNMTLPHLQELGYLQDGCELASHAHWCNHVTSAPVFKLTDVESVWQNTTSATCMVRTKGPYIAG